MNYQENEHQQRMPHLLIILDTLRPSQLVHGMFNRCNRGQLETNKFYVETIRGIFSWWTRTFQRGESCPSYLPKSSTDVLICYFGLWLCCCSSNLLSYATQTHLQRLQWKILEWRKLLLVVRILFKIPVQNRLSRSLQILLWHLPSVFDDLNLLCR